MRIDVNIESSTRTMLDHAMRGELEVLPGLFEALGDASRRKQCLELCVLVAGYIAVDVAGGRWPSESNLRKIAANAVKVETRLNLTESGVYDYLARVVGRSEPPNQVFTDGNDAIFAPILITASLLLTFHPREKKIWEYLDEIEQATEAAAALSPAVYPAVILRSQISAAAGLN